MRLFDLHCDTLYECYTKGESLWENTGAVDFKRGTRYQPWVQIFAVWIPDTVRGEKAWQHYLRIFLYTQQQVKKNKEISFVKTYEDFDNAIKNGKNVGLLGVEGGAALAGKPERLSILAKQGVKVITITWNGSNELGHGCLSKNNGGLTDMGKTVVCEMERCGILPDVSHLNEAGFYDVASVTQLPFIASHSVSMAVNSHPRNLRGEQIGLLRDRGGLIGLTVCKEQLGQQTFECLYRHLSHYWELGCERITALGFDLDGTAIPPEWQGIGVYELFAEYLQKRGMDAKIIDNLFFNNAYTFFSKFLRR